MLKPGITITDFHKGLKKKNFSATEAAKFFLERIKQEDQKIGSFLEVWEEEAQQEAERVDERIARGEEPGLLAGVPLAVKDNILIEGRESTGGSKILSRHRAEYTATAAARLEQAGVVWLGRTNMDEFAFGSSTEYSAWQKTRNPHDLERVPGGTSGGSAAAVAADLAVAALGSDTGGSIRQPASFCGIAGLRPSYGAIPRYGLMAAASSFDQIGTLTKTVADTAILFAAMAGHDQFDSTSVKSALSPEILRPDRERAKSLKLGIPKEWWNKEKGAFLGTDERTAAEMTAVITALQAAGVRFQEVEMKNVKYALAAYYVAIFAEESSNLARYDGLRYGAGKREKNLMTTYLKNRSRGFGEEAKRRVILGNFVLSAGFYEAYYGRAQKLREAIRQEMKRVMAQVDLLFMPTAPTTAFKIGEKTDDPLQMYYGDLFTVLASLTGQPALTVPVRRHGEKQEGLPVGFQLVGRRLAEEDVLGMGRFYEELGK